MKYCTAAVLFILFFTSCAKNNNKGIYDQGRIEYKITYLNGDQGNFDPALLPKKMVQEFSENLSINTIDGFMGFFKLESITYFGKKRSTTHLKVLNKDYVFKGDKNELMCCFELFDGMKIEHDTTTKIISGLRSKHAIITIPDTDYTFDIYYTNDINIQNPNATNPYTQIDGILTDFVLFMGPYKMRFVANKFNPEKVPDENTTFPEDSFEVTRSEMVYALERLMEQ